MHKVFVLIM